MGRKIYIDGKQVDIRNCQQAIAQGIAMVPEDRKRDGIVPVMAVGKNITLAALNKFTGGISQLDDAAEQKCILESIQQLKVKTSSPDLAIGRLSGGNQQKRSSPAVCYSTRAFSFLMNLPGVLILARNMRSTN